MVFRVYLAPILSADGVWMVQGGVHSIPWTQVGNMRQKWHPMLAGNWHFSETWQWVYIQWRRTYNNQTGRADSSPCLSCKTLWRPWSWRCGWNNPSSMQASAGERFNIRSVLRKVLHAYNLVALGSESRGLRGVLFYNMKPDTFYCWE